MRHAGIDIGGTKIDALIRDPDNVMRCYQWPTSEFESVDAVRYRASIHGSIDRMVIAAAGRVRKDGSVKLTNLEHWPAFRPDKDTSVINDIQGVALTLPDLRPDEFQRLNNVTTLAYEHVAVTISTGDNSAYLDTYGVSHPGETGHRGWQPWYDLLLGDLPMRFLQFLQERYPENAVITVEDAISGNRGFDNLYDFVTRDRGTYGKYESTLGRQVQEQRQLGKGIGPVITHAAIFDHSPYAVTCMRLWGAILGQYLRECALSHLTQGGTISLYGGVVDGKGVMEFVLNQTGFMRQFLGGSAKMNDLMSEIALRRLIRSEDNYPLAARGALELAKSA